MNLKIRLLKTMESLYSEYLSTRKNHSLVLLKQCMETYMEEGFFKKGEDDEFCKIWNDLFETEDYSYQMGKSIRANKIEIRNVLIKWNPRRHSMKIQDVVNDILKKVENKKFGQYNYWTEHNIRGQVERFSYVLCISEIGAVLYDEQKKIYYNFVK